MDFGLGKAKPSHKEASTRSKPSHKEALPHRSYYTQQAFTQRFFPHRSFCAQQAFTHKGFYLHTEAMAGGLAEGNEIYVDAAM